MNSMTSTSAMILADMEGITGIFAKEQCKTNTLSWWQARELITADVNCAATGLRRHGMRHIFIKDMHASGFNLIPERIDKSEHCRQGQFWYPVPLLGHIPDVCCAVMIGWHAGPDQQAAFSPHIFDKCVRWLKVDDALVTEVELFAAVLGEFGIPVTFMTADDVTLNRVRKNMPWIQGLVIPKERLSSGRLHAIHRELESQIAYHLTNSLAAKPFVLGRHSIEIKINSKILRWEATSAVESYKRILLKSVFRSYPAMLLPLLLWIYRARCNYLYNKPTKR